MDSNHNVVEKTVESVQEMEDDMRREEGTGTDPKRVIIFIDIDSFEEQIWRQRFRQDLNGKDAPIVVVNLDKQIISANYTAKCKGITKEGRLEEYQEKHPDLVVIETGERYGKQDTLTPQRVSDDIFRVLMWYKRTLRDPTSITIERSSKEEVYIDVSSLVTRRCRQPTMMMNDSQESGLRLPDDGRITLLTGAMKMHPNEDCHGKPKTIMEGRKGKISDDQLNYRILHVYKEELRDYHADEIRLTHGAVIADTLLRLIHRRMGFQASAGVAHNKLLAKLACGRNKPEGISILTDVSWTRVSKSIPFRQIRGFGGKEGEKLQQKLAEMCGKNIETMWDITRLKLPGGENEEESPLDILETALEAIGSKTLKAQSLLDKCHGRDESAVIQRHFSDSLTTSTPSLTGNRAVGTWNEFVARVEDLTKDMADKMDYQMRRWKRWPSTLHVEAIMQDGSGGSPGHQNNRLQLHGCIHWEEMEKFILAFVDHNRIHFRDVEKVILKADNFRRCN